MSPSYFLKVFPTHLGQKPHGSGSLGTCEVPDHHHFWGESLEQWFGAMPVAWSSFLCTKGTYAQPCNKNGQPQGWDCPPEAGTEHLDSSWSLRSTNWRWESLGFKQVGQTRECWKTDSRGPRQGLGDSISFSESSQRSKFCFVLFGRVEYIKAEKNVTSAVLSGWYNWFRGISMDSRSRNESVPKTEMFLTSMLCCGGGSLIPQMK